MPPPYCYDYPRPAVTVDLVAFALAGDSLRVLFIRRKGEPFAGRWALPGGFLEIDESVEAAARRELREETGCAIAGPVEFLSAFGAPGRDPRGRTISLVHAAVISGNTPAAAGGDDAAEAAWLNPDEVSNLAFDHDEILAAARAWLVRGVVDGRLGVALLPAPFQLKDVRVLHRAAGLPEAGARRWLGRLLREGRVVPVPGKKGRYEAERSASHRISKPIE